VLFCWRLFDETSRFLSLWVRTFWMHCIPFTVRSALSFWQLRFREISRDFQPSASARKKKKTREKSWNLGI
jgi:hypothetical protein